MKLNLAALVGTIFAIALSVSPVSASTPGAVGFGITANGRLVMFDLADPELPAFEEVMVSGLNPGETLSALDSRPADGALVALAINEAGVGRTLLINADPNSPAFGAATQIAVIGIALTATDYDIDFDPCSGELRVIGTDAGNLRVTDEPIPNTVPEFDLSYRPGDTATGIPRVAAAAYTPAAGGAAGSSECTTVLYDIDVLRNSLVRQPLPVEGRLDTVGHLGLDPTNLIGFDVAADGGAFVAALSAAEDGTSGIRTVLSTVNLETGELTPVGPVRSEILRSFAVVSVPGEIEVPALPLTVVLPVVAGLGVAARRILSSPSTSKETNHENKNRP